MSRRGVVDFRPEMASENGSGKKSAAASVLRDQLNRAYGSFKDADDLPQTLQQFQLICSLAKLQPAPFPRFFDQLQETFADNRIIRQMLDKLRTEAFNRGYLDDGPAEDGRRDSCRGRESLDVIYDDKFYVMEDGEGVCAKRKVLIVGGGPTGLRMAIEAQMMGATVKVIESRHTFSRYNIAQIWKLAHQDLTALGVRHFYKEFCSGNINTISIRKLQLVLVKVALVLGVEIYSGVTFESLVPPSGPDSGWRASVNKVNNEISEFEFDVIADATGKMNNVYRFEEVRESTEKKFQPQYMAVTGSFVFNPSNQGERFQEIPGVARRMEGDNGLISKLEEHDIHIDNLVYYRRETHYFIMTLHKSHYETCGLFKKVCKTREETFAPSNVNRPALENYVLKVANLVTTDSKSDLEYNECKTKLRNFRKMDSGENDASIFGYEAQTSANSSCRIIERKGHKLLVFLVGDGLIVPYWPLGSGVVKGFMSALDACWTMKIWSQNEGRITPCELLLKQETFYSRLKEISLPDQFRTSTNGNCRCDPWRRYTKEHVTKPKNACQYRKHYDTDIDLKGDELETVQLYYEDYCSISSEMLGEMTLLSWYCDLLHAFEEVRILDLTFSWKNGRALWAVLHICAENYIDWNLYRNDDFARSNQRAINIITLKFGIRPVMTGRQMANISDADRPKMFIYLDKLKDSLIANYKNEIENTLKQLSQEKRQQLQKYLHEHHTSQDSAVSSTDDETAEGTFEEEYSTIEGQPEVSPSTDGSLVRAARSLETTLLNESTPLLVSLPIPTDVTSSAEPKSPLPSGSHRLTTFAEVSRIVARKPALMSCLKPTTTKKKRKAISFKITKSDPDQVNSSFVERDARMSELREMAVSGFASKKYGKTTEAGEDIKTNGLGFNKWLQVNRQNPRMGSMPNLSCRMTTGEYCAACRLLIHAAGKVTSSQGLPVHSRCLRCAHCDRPCRGAYSYDAASARFFCSEHGATDGESAPVSSESDLDSNCDFVAETPDAVPKGRNLVMKTDDHDVTISTGVLDQNAKTAEYKAYAVQWLRHTMNSVTSANSKDEVRKAIAESVMEDPEMATIMKKAFGGWDSGASSWAGRQNAGRHSSVTIKINSTDDEGFSSRRNSFQAEILDMRSRSGSTASIPEVISGGRSVADIRSVYSVEQSQPSHLERSGTMPHAIKSNCHFCKLKVFLAEGIALNGMLVHRKCLKCEFCGITLTMKTTNFNKTTERFLCNSHKSSNVPGNLQRSATTSYHQAINTTAPPLAIPKPKKKTKLTRKFTKFFTGKSQQDERKSDV